MGSSRIKKGIQLLRNMGMKYILFRTQYELRRRSGLLKYQYPAELGKKEYISLNEWREKSMPFFFSNRNEIELEGGDCLTLSEDLSRILQGDCCLFSSTWYHLGTNYDWVTNPDTGYKYDVSKHWTEIEDISQEAGDIKFVWEKSRFSFLYTIIKYDQSTGESHAEFVFSQIVDWIDKNPLNFGPNYKCSQEISLRVLNWVFALYFYKGDAFLTEDVFQKILHSIYGQMLHVYSNIDFSRIAVRNNHAITETLALYIVGLLFPWYPDATKWKVKGKKWFEKEVAYQIAEDGTYLQFSMNYHRVVVQLLTWGIGLAIKNGDAFADVVYKRAYASVNFLFQCQILENGFLPNYGANDGALFFRLNNADYRDYRPQLDALHYALTGKNLYSEEFEDRKWYGLKEGDKEFPSLELHFGCVSFDLGGYYLIREEDTLTFIRCGKHKSRPSHADNLHVDVWYKGENILLDGGSYKYNTENSFIKYFMGTESHNTVMLDNYDQMLKGPRFVWYNWSQSENVALKESADTYVFEGQIACFATLGKDIKHYRKLVKWKNVSKWEIKDVLENKPGNVSIRQIWHTQNNSLDLKSVGNKCMNQSGWYSGYYGRMEKCKQVIFETKNTQIETTIQLN